MESHPNSPLSPDSLRWGQAELRSLTRPAGGRMRGNPRPQAQPSPAIPANTVTQNDSRTRHYPHELVETSTLSCLFPLPFPPHEPTAEETPFLVPSLSRIPSLAASPLPWPRPHDLSASISALSILSPSCKGLMVLRSCSKLPCQLLLPRHTSGTIVSSQHSRPSDSFTWSFYH